MSTAQVKFTTERTPNFAGRRAWATPLRRDRLKLMLGGFGRSREQPGLALVLEPEAVSVDADDGRVVKDAIEHRGGEHAVAGEGAIPAAEGEIRGEDHRAAFVAARDATQLRHPAAIRARICAAACDRR